MNCPLVMIHDKTKIKTELRFFPNMQSQQSSMKEFALNKSILTHNSKFNFGYTFYVPGTRTQRDLVVSPQQVRRVKGFQHSIKKLLI